MEQRYPVIVESSPAGFVAWVPDLHLVVPSATHDRERLTVLVKDAMFTTIKALTEDGCDIPPPAHWFAYLDKVPPNEPYYLLFPEEDVAKYDRPDVPLIKRQITRIRLKKFGKIPDGIHNAYIYPEVHKEKTAQLQESA